jgi:sulfur-carrier protein
VNGVRVVVRLPSVLAAHDGVTARVVLDVAGPHVTVDAVLDALEALHPGVGRRIRDERGVARPHVNLFLGRGEDFARVGPRSAVTTGAELVVLPAVSGGARPI